MSLDDPADGMQRTPGEVTCGALYDGRCYRPAVRHLLFTEDGDNGVACALHLDDTRRAQHPIVAEHDLNAACTMPASVWHEDGCYVPGLPSAEVLEQARGVPA